MCRNLHPFVLMALVAVAACWIAPAGAQVYKCTSADGSVAYQDHACARGQAQQVMDVPSRAPPGYVPPPVATSPPPASAGVSSPPPYVPPPSTPLPQMFACVGAVNGKHYLTRHPPPPYLAPLGVMGYPPQTLSQAYGAPGGAGPSAPELSRPPVVGGPSIATGMTEVQDYCLPATRAQVCSFVRKEYDENHRKLRMAMRNEEPPLEAREKHLEAQLRNCR